MISSNTPEVWKTRKSTAVFLLSQRCTFGLFMCFFVTGWSGTKGSERRNDTWQILCLASQCSLSFFRPLFLSVSWHLMCASHSPGLWFFDALPCSRMRNCHIFLFLFFILSLFQSFHNILCLSFDLTWFNLALFTVALFLTLCFHEIGTLLKK